MPAPTIRPIALLLSHGVAAAMLLFSTASIADETDADRPNVIFIITDDQRWDAMGCVQREMGDDALFPWFETPHMDRLAAEGARFRNAFVVHSLCSPSRASFLTGRPTHRHGVIHNWEPMPTDLANWAQGLADAGYQTAYFGKWHMGQQKARPGFGYVFSYLGQGKYNDCVFFENGVKSPTTGWVDDVATDRAIDYLRKHADKPFGMVIGYKSPHEPRQPPARRATDFADIELTVPDSHFSIPPFRGPDYRPLSFKNRMEDRRRYFRCVAAIDDCLGRVLDTLDELGIAENTVVVFAGDNGYFLGEHASHDKRWAYEESIRIPLLVRYPARVKAGAVIDDMALNIDLAPTILDLAGLAAPDGMVGQSWAPLFDPEDESFARDGFLYECYQDPEFPKVTMDTLAYRSASGKLIIYPGNPQWTEAFDLTTDPKELHDRVRDASFASQRDVLIARLRAAMREAELGDPDLEN